MMAPHGLKIYTACSSQSKASKWEVTLTSSFRSWSPIRIEEQIAVNSNSIKH